MDVSLSPGISENFGEDVEKRRLLGSEPSASKPSESGKREDIQGLRAIAVTYVIVFHLKATALPHGFLGVDVFFVLSGYLITMILSRNERLSISDVWHFFERRFKRIVPAYSTTIFLVLCSGLYFLNDNDRRLLFRDVRWAIPFASNIQKLIDDNDYFAELNNFNFLLHSWSLAVEIQFYLLAPLLVCLRQSTPKGYLWVAVIAIASLYLHVSSTRSLSFCHTASRLWQFIVGGVAYEIYTRMQNDNGCVGKIPGTGMLRYVVHGFSLFVISPVFLMLFRDDVLCRCAVTVAAGCLLTRPAPRISDRLLCHPVLSFIGDISYSLYLAHWPIILFIKYIDGSETLTFTEMNLAVELTVILSLLSYYCIERYFIRSIWTRSVLYVGVLTILTVALMGVRMSTWEQQKQPDGATSNATVPLANSSAISAADYQNWDFLEMKRTEPLTEAMRQKAMQEVKKELSLRIVWDPPFAEGPGNTTVIVYGNSYAQHAFSMIKEVFGTRLKWIRVLGSGCNPFLGKWRSWKGCPAFNNASVQTIEETKPDIVFLNFLSDPPMNESVKNNNLAEDEPFADIQRTLDRISKVSKVIVVSYTIPLVYQKSISSWVYQRLTSNQTLDDVYIDYSFFWQREEPLFRRLRGVRCEKCEWLFPHRLFCYKKICHVFDPVTKLPYYRDNCHLHVHGHKHIQPIYRSLVEELYLRKTIS